MVKLARELFDCDVGELVNIDSQFSTCDSDMTKWDKPATELLNQGSDHSEDEEEKCVSVSRPVSLDDACVSIHKLKEVALQNGSKGMLKISMDYEEFLIDMRVTKTTKQTSFKYFFVKVMF
ncbi:hypothetical protein DPMN_064435 [Dreissena polymorpha]|uniref:Uncharacterized protein n=1 Tax=Dreissena polymorpha TaxID=45954 RepID=A0A9D4CD72_DREPO|nr:hypothetical protein DPMN_064435 [Dreissena polymorpha]